MQAKVSRDARWCRRSAFLPVLILEIVLNVILTAGAPSVGAQESMLESADGEISGTVLVEPGQKPASQVPVSLRSRVAGTFRSVLTDLEGHFKVQNLPRGDYEIAVNEAGYEFAQTSTQLDGASAKLVLYLKSKPAIAPRSKYLVSVRELRIPDKARKELNKGLELAAKNDFSGSLSHFTKASLAFPGYYEADYNLGVAEMALGRRADAMKDFQTAVDSSGGRYALAQFGIGYLLCQERKSAEAEKVIRRGLETDDNSAEGYVLLTEALMQLNRLDEAEKSAHEALLRNPRHAGVYLAQAEVAGNKGNYREMIEDLDEFLKLKPTGSASDEVRRVRESALKNLAASAPPH